MTDEEKRFDRREEARLDDMYDAQYAVDEAFNRWWNDDALFADNPFNEDTPAFWAWEGWVAGVRAEREACAKVCDELVLEHPGRADLTAKQCATAIRARGQR